jgi:hypothetical protein
MKGWDPFIQVPCISKQCSKDSRQNASLVVWCAPNSGPTSHTVKDTRRENGSSYGCPRPILQYSPSFHARKHLKDIFFLPTPGLQGGPRVRNHQEKLKKNAKYELEFLHRTTTQACHHWHASRPNSRWTWNRARHKGDSSQRRAAEASLRRTMAGAAHAWTCRTDMRLSQKAKHACLGVPWSKDAGSEPGFMEPRGP